MAIYDIESAALRVGRSVRTLKRWEAKGWLTFTLGRVREADLLEADKKARANRGGVRTKGDVTVAELPGDLLEEANWPVGAVADGKVYSLEVSPNMRLDEEAFARNEDDPWVRVEPDVNIPPEFGRMTGTYVDVSRRAFQLNLIQRRSGFNAWVFYVSPVEPQSIG